jgi:hypothetical protein
VTTPPVALRPRRWPWRAVLCVTVLLILMVMTPAAAAAPTGAPCTDTATVGWSVDLDSGVVTGATVAVRGCADGEIVGLQLLTVAGDVPAEEPLVADVEAERATFDLTPFALRVEPIVGVRVFLIGADDGDLVVISVDQRFFNRPGNEQVGLRQLAVLQLPVGSSYLVPGPPSGYVEVHCEFDLGLLPADDHIGDGSGSFTAVASGVHRVCHQRRPGPPGGPPQVEAARVLPDVVDVADARSVPNGDVAGVSVGGLALTGANLVVLMVVGAVLVVLGQRLRRGGSCRPSTGAGGQRSSSRTSSKASRGW